VETALIPTPVGFVQRRNVSDSSVHQGGQNLLLTFNVTVLALKTAFRHQSSAQTNSNLTQQKVALNRSATGK
jgi:hypothetical protein